MFEPFSQSSGKAKLVNLIVLLIILMAWIGCCVGWGADLAQFKSNGVTVKVYQNKVVFDGTSVGFDDFGENSCGTASKAFVAMLVFAFLALTFAFILLFSRLAGFNFPKVSGMDQSLSFEFISMLVATFFYFLAVCIWGGACFTDIRKLDSAVGTGYGYILFCFFMLIIGSILLFLEKGNSDWQIGHGSGGNTGTIGGSDYDPHADPSAGYSYQGPSGTAQGGYDQQTSL